ncbi:CAP domain-containing protein [uncultured Alsobacter sp.]|uniref:CAP domain-containing protein n=1 Tax=uncultured Alsobacter sp. TaxID=1748258 RepID=UPI0025D0F156|nr:CAP domain-containing protein [uncultured Alsobacter sp.]
MSRRVFAGAVRGGLALAVAVSLASCSTPPVEEATPGFYRRLDEGASLDAQGALSLINSYRVRNGLTPLALDEGLSEEARRRASTMAAADTSTWGQMPTLTAAAGRGGAQVRAERASAGYRTVAEAFSGWRDSPPHNRVLLEPRGTRLGIAAVDRPGTKYRVYWDIIVAGPDR